ncbi:hypothetical protein UVI_02060370 [Ustilaginoidea virens]|uniref:Uncharacterized protein n=1 Tax=Ustilaginoidea virens TaxID=1159556 RepID=A0A1B5L6K9_USTVR|nr:hypothetical protein UVI_02060370 [Ustilaginoidea virens]
MRGRSQRSEHFPGEKNANRGLGPELKALSGLRQCWAPLVLANGFYGSGGGFDCGSTGVNGNVYR